MHKDKNTFLIFIASYIFDKGLGHSKIEIKKILNHIIYKIKLMWPNPPNSRGGFFYLLSCLIVFQGILKGEVLLYCWPPVWLVWNQLYDSWQFLFLFVKQTNPNQSNRRYSDTSPCSIPWFFKSHCLLKHHLISKIKYQNRPSLYTTAQWVKNLKGLGKEH